MKATITGSPNKLYKVFKIYGHKNTGCKSYNFYLLLSGHFEKKNSINVEVYIYKHKIAGCWIYQKEKFIKSNIRVVNRRVTTSNSRKLSTSKDRFSLVAFIYMSILFSHVIWICNIWIKIMTFLFLLWIIEFCYFSTVNMN